MKLPSEFVSIVRSGVGKLQENRYFGHLQGFIYRNGPLLHSIRCFMLVAIMCKKHLPCLWNRYYALILPDL